MVKPLSAAAQAKLALPYGSTIPAVIDPTLSLGEILLVHAHILHRDRISSLMNSQNSPKSQIDSTTLPKPASGDAKNSPQSRTPGSRR
jgi:hypothetical protein